MVELTTLSWIEAFFIFFVAAIIFRNLAFFISAILFKPKRKKFDSDYHPFVSVLIPAYNEEKVVAKSLNRILNINYENYEVIFIDDGSDDGTFHEAEKVAAANDNTISLTILTQKNSGKATALNNGLIHAKGEIILCTDADSYISADGLRQAVANFKDDNIGAVTGIIKVMNKVNLLTHFQHIEYHFSQLFVRSFFSNFGFVYIIPGPAGIFRRKALAQAQGYCESRKLFAEDAEMTLKLLCSGWKVISDQRLQVYTEVPEKTSDLLRQRYRWARGIFQALYTNFYSFIIADSWKGPIAALILTYEYLFTNIVGYGIFVFLLANILQSGSLEFFSVIMIVFIASEVLAFVTVFERRQLWITIPLFLLGKTTYHIMIMIWGFYSLCDELLSHEMTWDKLSRSGD